MLQQNPFSLSGELILRLEHGLEEILTIFF
jgi:hypothetical protein